MKRNFMPRTLESPKRRTADQIAKLADKGKDISRFFTNSGKMMPPIQRVNVDFAQPMLEELDERARQLNISRQAVIKTLIRLALDQQHLARKTR
jgi:DNA invertase Pin-like site-specific DNA recombinase